MRERKYTASFIDQGYCFNAGEWTFPDYPLRGVYARNEVYEGVRGWESFEPWLSRVETMGEDVVWGIVNEIPPEWYASESDELEKLARTLIGRRGIVRELIAAFRESPRRPFPNWGVKEALSEVEASGVERGSSGDSIPQARAKDSRDAGQLVR